MKILIVDDEKNIRDLMGRYFATDGIESVGSENAYSAQRLLRQEFFDGALIDLKMPGMNGLELIKWIRSEGFRMPIIMASAHGDISDAVDALKSGAQDYVVKPFNPEELVIKFKALTEAQNLRNIKELQSSTPDISFVGTSPQIMRIKELIARIAPTSSTVLITGESGTGKEVAARSIHKLSKVSDGPFVAINIGGVPENLLESELFGYEKGAFTGAVSRKNGLFEMANGGTLFLDEIGDMPMHLQVKLLRVLQEKCISRLGGTETIPINARIICATNKELEKMVNDGKFREDLFYRLNVVRITIPALRERSEDIPPLCTYLLERLNVSMGRKLDGFTPKAMELLKNHKFYGNVRELENILERAVIFSDGNLITEDSLELRQPFAINHNTAKTQYEVETEGVSLKELEKKAIATSLRRWEGNRTKASEELGITRRTLITKIKEYNLGEDDE